MANKHRGEVDITLLGDFWTLRPTFGALAEIEDATGLGLAAVVQRIEAVMRHESRQWRDRAKYEIFNDARRGGVFSRLSRRS